MDRSAWLERAIDAIPWKASDPQSSENYVKQIAALVAAPLAELEEALQSALGKFLYAPVSVCRDCLSGERDCACIPTCLGRNNNYEAGLGILQAALARLPWRKS